jgi:hypothetical protein
VAIGQLHLEHGVFQRFAHRAFQHDGIFLPLRQGALLSNRTMLQAQHLQCGSSSLSRGAD